jgi:hypothetical protein
MGMRRRARRRGLVAGAVVGGAVAHNRAARNAPAQSEPAYEEAPVYEPEVQYAPPPASPSDEIEHLAQLHASGVLSDEEFTAAKMKVLGS